MQRSQRVVGWSQCRLGKGFRRSPWIPAYICNQRGWGKQVRVGAWEGVVAPFYQDLQSRCSSEPPLFGMTEPLFDAASLSGGGPWFLADSSLMSGEACHVIFDPQLVIDLRVCPGCASSLSLAVVEGPHVGSE